jgi:hypothetical protein
MGLDRVNDSSWYIPFVLAVIVGVVWLDDIDEWWSNDNTVYYIECKNENTKPMDCPKNKTRFRTITYTVYPEAQIVFFGSDGGDKRLEGTCSVWDRNDWMCINTNSEIGTYVHMIHGKLIRVSLDESIAYMSKAEWAFNGIWSTIKLTPK